MNIAANVHGLIFLFASWMLYCSGLFHRYTHLHTQIIVTAQCWTLKQKAEKWHHTCAWHGGSIFPLSFAFTAFLTASHHPLLPFILFSPSLSLPRLLAVSCLFHRALQHLRINKLYISLCTHFKAPFRKEAQLICPWASVYPKWLFQTWSWESGSPNCPCLFVMYLG